MNNNNEEKIVSLTEQGNFGLGIQEITDKKDQEQIKENMKKKNN